MALEKIIRETFKFDNEQLVSALSESAQIRTFKKNEIIIAKNEIRDDILINLSGAFRGFYYDSEGNEITNSISDETGYFIMSCNPICERSRSYLKAITDMTTLAFPRKDLHILSSDYPEIMNYYNEFLLKASDKHLKTREVCFYLEAKEKYQWFLETYPNLAHCMQVKDIASFLQMTPVTLSRIRHQLKNSVETKKAHS